MDIYIKEGTDFFTEENLVDLWHSVGWVNGSTRVPGRLLQSLKNASTVFSYGTATGWPGCAAR